MPLPFTDPFKYKNNFTIDNLKYFAYQANTGKQQPVQFGEGQVVKIFHQLISISTAIIEAPTMTIIFIITINIISTSKASGLENLTRPNKYQRHGRLQTPTRFLPETTWTGFLQLSMMITGHTGFFFQLFLPKNTKIR